MALASLRTFTTTLTCACFKGSLDVAMVMRSRGKRGMCRDTWGLELEPAHCSFCDILWTEAIESLMQTRSRGKQTPQASVRWGGANSQLRCVRRSSLKPSNMVEGWHDDLLGSSSTDLGEGTHCVRQECLHEIFCQILMHKWERG